MNKFNINKTKNRHIKIFDNLLENNSKNGQNIFSSNKINKNQTIGIVISLLICVFNFFSLFNISPAVLNAKVENDLPQGTHYQCYKYEGEIPHFFTHQIINNPKKAFNSKLARHYDKDCITHTEFKNFLQAMYQNNYCLIDIYDIVGYKNQEPYFKDVFVPLGKKPFLLSFDDMSYDSIGLGLSDKIILDENECLASFTQNNENQIEYDKEAFCILEDFIKLHPDFSHKNARAIICPTGYDGILGYRINKNGINQNIEIENIKPLINKLKNLGYRFACHSYNHLQVAFASPYNLERDLQRYDDEIVSVIGKTDIFCFPGGSKIEDGQKLSILKNHGYKIFFCVGDAKNTCSNGAVFLKREVLNGNSLRYFRHYFQKWFDTKKIYDHQHRTIPFPKN